jgi:hypothetical protein
MNTGNSCLNFYAARKLRFSTLAVYCLSLLLSSCAQTPQTITTDEPPQFERLALITPEMFTGIERADSHSDYVDDALFTGTAVGAVGGALIGAAACGPFFYGVCVFIFATQGMAVGGVAGLAGGALYATTGFSHEDALYINEILPRLDQERDFQQELAVHLKLELPREMQSTPELADVQVLVILDRINIIQRYGNKIQIETAGLLVLSWKVDEKRQTTHTIEFHSMSPEGDIDLWLADGGTLFGVAISDSLFDLATQMTATLLQAWTPSAIGEIE